MTEVRVIRPWRGTGPVHLESEYNLAWCGMRGQFRHRNEPLEAPEPIRSVNGSWFGIAQPAVLEAVTCPKCRAAMRAGRPRAWRKR